MIMIQQKKMVICADKKAHIDQNQVKVRGIYFAFEAHIFFDLKLNC